VNIEKHVEQTLKDFSSIGVLGEILFIGAWARYFYKSYFPSKVDYYPRMATKDLDILFKESAKKRSLVVDLHKKLIAEGYRHEIYQNNIIKYYKNELELEFLIPTNGEKKIVEVKAFNVTAQELPYLGMLWDDPVQAKYGKYKIWIPDPYKYVFHKLIIAQSRSKNDTKIQDIRDAEDVAAALESQGEFNSEIKEVLERLKLNLKSKTKIKESLKEFLDPDLRQKLLDLM
jgi:hypothetical protein